MTETLATLDWAKATELAGGNEALAKDLFTLLIQSLRDERPTIERCFQAKDWPKLQYHVHRLHGSTSYCGVPALKAIAHTLDQQLRQSDLTDIDNRMQTLYNCMDNLLNEAIPTS